MSVFTLGRFIRAATQSQDKCWQGAFPAKPHELIHEISSCCDFMFVCLGVCFTIWLGLGLKKHSVRFGKPCFGLRYLFWSPQTWRGKYRCFIKNTQFCRLKHGCRRSNFLSKTSFFGHHKRGCLKVFSKIFSGVTLTNGKKQTCTAVYGLADLSLLTS